MYLKKKTILLSIIFGLLITLYSCFNFVGLKQLKPLTSSYNSKFNGQGDNKKTQGCRLNSLKFIITNNKGSNDLDGSNYVIIFDSKSKNLDFKASLALAHNVYAKEAKGKFRRDYIPKQFHEIIADNNAKLNKKSLVAAINGDYIDPENQPQGLNISRA